MRFDGGVNLPFHFGFVLVRIPIFSESRFFEPAKLHPSTETLFFSQASSKRQDFSSFFEKDI
jgi:hypothetical protein